MAPEEDVVAASSNVLNVHEGNPPLFFNYLVSFVTQYLLIFLYFFFTVVERSLMAGEDLKVLDKQQLPRYGVKRPKPEELDPPSGGEEADDGDGPSTPKKQALPPFKKRMQMQSSTRGFLKQLGVHYENDNDFFDLEYWSPDVDRRWTIDKEDIPFLNGDSTAAWLFNFTEVLKAQLAADGIQVNFGYVVSPEQISCYYDETQSPSLIYYEKDSDVPFADASSTVTVGSFGGNVEIKSLVKKNSGGSFTLAEYHSSDTQKIRIKQKKRSIKTLEKQDVGKFSISATKVIAYNFDPVTKKFELIKDLILKSFDKPIRPLITFYTIKRVTRSEPSTTKKYEVEDFLNVRIGVSLLVFR
ncbi:hypothetical protein CCFV1_ORF096 [Cotesia congregata filamentous virus 1]|uniref:Uncharacterized protein n=1 Tax=Cotesia congregata filamentous virus 1 TaxID=3064291 RepID=A0ABC8QJR6_9VIRU|nr:hypothetical protein CCFV1_ORF096 [Cotesia congregata filamentous virus 1]